MDGITIPIYSDIIQLKNVVKPYNSLWYSGNLVQRIENINNNINNINSRINSIVSEINNYANIIKTLNNKVNQNINNINKNTKNINNILSNLKTVNSDIQDLFNDISNINKQINDMNKKIKDNTTDIANIDNMINNISLQINQINQKMDTVTDKVNKFRDTIKSSIQNLINMVESFRSNFENIKNDVTNVNTAISNVNVDCTLNNIKNAITKLKRIAVGFSNPFGFWNKTASGVSAPSVKSYFYDMISGVYSGNYSPFNGKIIYIDPLTKSATTCYNVACLINTMLHKAFSHLNYVANNWTDPNVWDDFRAGINLIVASFTMILTYFQTLEIHPWMINSFGVNNIGLRSCGKGCLVIAWVEPTYTISNDPHSELKNWIRIYLYDSNGNLTNYVGVNKSYYNDIENSIKNKINSAVSNVNSVFTWIINKLKGSFSKTVNTGIDSYVSHLYEDNCYIQNLDTVYQRIKKINDSLNNLNNNLNQIQLNLQNLLGGL